jgi:hypothetical protein
MNKSQISKSVAILIAVSSVAYAEQNDSNTVYSEMPVKEVTVFKDGHAFVLHSGEVATDADGKVTMDYLPAPVIGTFWPYSADKKVELKSVKSGRKRIRVDRTALNLRQLIEANIGANVIITEQSLTYEATIVELPFQSAEELETNDPNHSHNATLTKGDVVLLKTTNGTKVVRIDKIQDITFKDQHKSSLSHEEYRNHMSLEFDWKGRKPQKTIEAGMVYLQRGIRWIPSYRVVIDGNGKAKLSLNATVVNELVDIDNVTLNLVIGVPSFAFKDAVDPISLQQAVAQLSRSFQENTQTAYAFSNAIMSQRMAAPRQVNPVRTRPENTIDLGPAVAGSGKSEDLYVFTIKGVSLQKGERMVIPVTEFELEYKDVYTLDVPFTPPPDVWRSMGQRSTDQMAQMFNSPRVMHKIRLANSSKYPLTTAPALILRDNRVLAQSMMTYTATGASSDLELTVAVNVQIKKSDKETKRTPNAVNWNGNSYSRIDLQGTITLTSFEKDDVEVEIVRSVLGNIDKASHNADIEMVNIFEDRTFASGEYPVWWGWYSWPYWWYHFNSVGRITWTETLEKDKPQTFDYTWHYFWR